MQCCVRTDTFGIYVVMFIETLKTLVRVLGLFLTLLMGFAFSFHILLTVFLADNATDVCNCTVQKARLRDD